MYDGEYDDLDSNDLSENDYSDEGNAWTFIFVADLLSDFGIRINTQLV